MIPIFVFVFNFNFHMIGSGIKAHRKSVKTVMALSTYVASMNFFNSMHFRPGTVGSQLPWTGVHWNQMTKQKAKVEEKIRTRLALSTQRNQRVVPLMFRRKSSTDILTNMRPTRRKNSPTISVFTATITSAKSR
jgi:hypothetical protein